MKLTALSSRRALAGGVVLLIIVAGVIALLRAGRPAGPAIPPLQVTDRAAPGQPTVCGQRILSSPFSYDGRAGSYRSGTPGLPTYGTPGSDFPKAHSGQVLPTGSHSYQSWQLRPSTVYYLLPGTHVGAIQADTGDAFVGGRAHGVSATLTGDYKTGSQAIDSNSTDGDASGVTIEYLTIEKFLPPGDAAAVNENANTGWTIRYSTVTLNVPGAGIILGADNTLQSNCLTLNGQYGFQSTDVSGFGADALTDGPYNVTVAGNEISYNDTCDFEGTFSNAAVGWSDYDPIPARYRNPHCGPVQGDGNQGGFKLWQTNGVTIRDNNIHNNWGPGVWADTGNANTTITGNTITDNDSEGIIEEISYNFSITGNYIARNDWVGGLSNSGFPGPAIYVSESGSDTQFGGIPACSEASCADQGAYSRQSVISHNTLVDNAGNIFLWQNSNRFCSDGSDGICTWVKGGRHGPFTEARCQANLPKAAVNTKTYTGKMTGSPAEDWWDGCQWKTENVQVTHNSIYFNPAHVPGCNERAWPDCGAGGIFSEYGSPPNNAPGWITTTQLTFHQGNVWSDNTYVGPSAFYAWNQGNGRNPVTWAAWTGQRTGGDQCGSAQEKHSGYCDGPFGQDAGSTYDRHPGAPPAADPPARP